MADLKKTPTRYRKRPAKTDTSRDLPAAAAAAAATIVGMSGSGSASTSPRLDRDYRDASHGARPAATPPLPPSSIGALANQTQQPSLNVHKPFAHSNLSQTSVGSGFSFDSDGSQAHAQALNGHGPGSQVQTHAQVQAQAKALLAEAQTPLPAGLGKPVNGHGHGHGHAQPAANYSNPSRPRVETRTDRNTSSGTGTGERVEVVRIQLPTQIVQKEVLPSLTVTQLLSELLSEHRYEMTSTKIEDLVLWEVIPELALTRPLRAQEVLKLIVSSWEHDSPNYLEVGSYEARLDLSSIACLTPRRDLITRGASFNGKVQYCKSGVGAGGWKKGIASVSDGVLRILAKSGSSLMPSDAKDVVKSVTIHDYDLYEVKSSLANGIYKPKTIQSLKTCLILRSQQSPDFFVNKTDGVLAICPSTPADFDMLRNICFSLRTQSADKLSRSYVNSLTSPVSPSEGAKNLLNLHGPDAQEKNPIAAPVDEVGLGISKIKVSNPGSDRPRQPAARINPDGLLGDHYDAKVQSANGPAHTNGVNGGVITNGVGGSALPASLLAHNNVISATQFAPNSLLAKAAEPANGGFERGLLGRSYTTRAPRDGSPRALAKRSASSGHRAAIPGASERPIAIPQGLRTNTAMR